MARLRLPFDMHFTQKTYYFQKIVTSPFLGQKLQMTHQNVRKKEGFYPIIITCLLCLLFLEKKWRWFFWQWRGYGFPSICISHKKILFSKNCHVAVSVSKVTNDPSKCSQERGLLPYYHNLFVIFGKKWRWFFWQWRGYGFPSICISHKKHTIFKKLSRRRFCVKSYEWPIKMFARKRAFTLLS